MKIMNQPFNGQLGNQLIELLRSQHFHTVNIAVAFARNSGVLRIKDPLVNFRERGGLVNAYVGVDSGVTSYEALTALLICTDSLSVVHFENDQTFHPKIYQFLGNEKSLIIIGSHNLTGGGLWTNCESSAHFSMDMSNPDDIEILKTQDDYLKNLVSLKDSFMPLDTKEDVEKLLQNGYIFKEISQQLRSAKASRKVGNQKRLFDNGVPAALPRISTPSNEAEAGNPDTSTTQAAEQQRDQSETIWLETRKLTGGSRNILDLSMKSLVERGEPNGTPFDLGEPGFMRGGVEFFGINPAGTGDSKNITLNFEGVDYINNTILFPSGDSANGTWRLQIKGISSSGEKITDAFRTKGEEHYLVEKIVTFTKVDDDYYSISVYPGSELESFEAVSQILARNGSTTNAKRLGLF